MKSTKFSIISIHQYYINVDKSLAIAEGPRDALCQLKSCQLQQNCKKNHSKRYVIGE